MMLTTGKAAKMLGVTVTTIVRMLETGELEGYRVRSHYRISEEAVKRYLEKALIKGGK